MSTIPHSRTPEPTYLSVRKVQKRHYNIDLQEERSLTSNPVSAISHIRASPTPEPTNMSVHEVQQQHYRYDEDYPNFMFSTFSF